MSLHTDPDHLTGDGPRGVKNASHLSLDWLGAVLVRIFVRLHPDLPRGRRPDTGGDPRGQHCAGTRNRTLCRVPQVQQGKKTHRGASFSGALFAHVPAEFEQQTSLHLFIVQISLSLIKGRLPLMSTECVIMKMAYCINVFSAAD